MGRKLGAMPLLGEAVTPSNTTSPGPRFTSVPSGILIHPAVWPQQAWDKNWVGTVPLGYISVGESLDIFNHFYAVHAESYRIC